MLRRKKLEKIANTIYDLEQNIALGKDVKSQEKEIQKISESLSIEDMMVIDEYLEKKFNQQDSKQLISGQNDGMMDMRSLRKKVKTRL